MQMDRPIPTLDDVAKAAKVSTATVSRCINLPDRVAKATLDRVNRSIIALGYTPNFGARVMAAKRTMTVGAIIPTMENAVFAKGLQAFQEELHSHGYTLLVSSSAYDPDLEIEQIRALVSRGADALLLIGYDRDPSIYEYLKQQNVPVLIAWAFSRDQDQPSIGFDNRRSMYRLARHVIDLGHSQIGVISGIVKGNDRAAERLEGIRDALRDSGLDPRDLQIIETPYDIRNGQDALDRLMQVNPRITVVMCGNDVLAAGALNRARTRGLTVPDDLSITGFDDIDIAEIVTPSLTTVHVPHREMGRKAAMTLVNILKNSDSTGSLELQANLKIRNSLGVPPVQDLHD